MVSSEHVEQVERQGAQRDSEKTKKPEADEQADWHELSEVWRKSADAQVRQEVDVPALHVWQLESHSLHQEPSEEKE